MTFEELKKEVEHIYLKGFVKIKPTPEETRIIKQLYTSYLIGHWTALERPPGFFKDKYHDGKNSDICWWYHVAKGLIAANYEMVTRTQLPAKLPSRKIDFSAITASVANP